ncbi:MAG TPA: sugar ABC transporter ATP-binding protein [Acidimicrobiales bacterium]|nr:sugar ABC transporter ATP-binding protein [Acidimicrobiales bacterium]
MAEPGQPGDPQTAPQPAPAHDGPPTAGSPSGAALRIDHLSKTFPGTRALNDVSFEIRPGEIHALVGGNGSGKSTLIKILAGVYHGDPGGTITVGDTTVPADHTTPAKARAMGLHFVHQNPAVFPDLSVAENMVIGHGFDTTPVGSIRWRGLRRQTQALLDRFEINVRPEALVRSLRPAERSMVAIARALQDQEGQHTGVLVLDEPTASLPRAEVVRLMGALDRFAAAGQTILFVSHRLDEVIDTAARATVLRDGQLAGTLVGDEITEPRLIELIAGRTLDRMYPVMPPVAGDEVALEAKGLTGGPLRGVDFQLRRGEVLGIAGLLGSGRSELLKMIFGAYPIRSGTLVVEGRPVRFHDIGDAMAAGIAYVPEDRGSEAAFLDQTLSDNVVASSIRRYWRGMKLRNRAIDHDARDIIQRYFIRASSEQQKMGTLSGGNQQKVVLARWLALRPRVLIVDEPTRGIDVGAKVEVHNLLFEMARSGIAIIAISSELPEVLAISDRIVTMREGRVTGEMMRAEATEEALMALMTLSRKAA